MTIDPTEERPEPEAGLADETDFDDDDDDDDDDEAGDEPGDDSFLMGATGVQAQVEAELARAEAELAGEGPVADDDGAEV